MSWTNRSLSCMEICRLIGLSVSMLCQVPAEPLDWMLYEACWAFWVDIRCVRGGLCFSLVHIGALPFSEPSVQLPSKNHSCRYSQKSINTNIFPHLCGFIIYQTGGVLTIKICLDTLGSLTHSGCLIAKYILKEVLKCLWKDLKKINKKYFLFQLFSL